MTTTPTEGPQSPTRQGAVDFPTGELVLEPAGDHAWRVCNGRVPRGQGRFLAFVEEKRDGFEVMQLADDFVWTTYPTLSDALEHVAESGVDHTTGAVINQGMWIR